MVFTTPVYHPNIYPEGKVIRLQHASPPNLLRHHGLDNSAELTSHKHTHHRYAHCSHSALARFASPSSTRLEMISGAMRRPWRGGVPCSAWKRYCCLSSPCCQSQTQRVQPTLKVPSCLFASCIVPPTQVSSHHAHDMGSCKDVANQSRRVQTHCESTGGLLAVRSCCD